MNLLKNFTIFNFIILLYILLVFFNFKYLLEFFQYALNLFYLNNTQSYFTPEFSATLVLNIIFVILPLLTIPGRIKKVLKHRITFTRGFLIFLAGFICFPTLFASQSAAFFPEKSGYRLLSPFTEYHYTESDVDQMDNSQAMIAQRENLLNFKTVKKKEYLSADETKSGSASGFFILGTDYLGRDLFSLIVRGTRVSFIISVGAGSVAAILGIIFGFISGYDTKFTGKLLDRLSDTLLAIPGIFFVLLLTLFFSSNLIMLVLILGLSGWMSLFKIVRTEVNEIKRKDYFKTSRLMGFSSGHLIAREIFPVIMGPIVVNITFLIANIILAEAALSYLGVDFGTDTPTWGQLIEDGQQYIRNNWWLVMFPAITLSFTIVSLNSSAKNLQKKFRF